MKYKVRSFFSYFLHLYLLLWLHTIHVQAANTAKWVTGTNLHARAGSVSRDGKILAYVRDKESSSEMWIKYLNDTGGGVKIFEATGTIELPHWSPGRKFLVFGVKDDGMGRIYRKNLATNDPPIALTKAGINCFHPTISPDESQIAYDSDESGNFDIWTMNLKTFEKRQITNYRNHDFYPTFSPDGKSLAYTSFRNETFHLFLKDLTINGSRPVQLTQGEMISAHPAFSLDGQGIYFDSNLNGENQIFFLNLHNYSMYQVTEGELKAKYPVMGSGVLVFEAEEAGVRGVRMLSLNEKARNRWKKESPPVEFEDSQPQPVQAQLVNDSEDFEKDLSLIRIEKDQLIKNPALPTTQFEEADFNLNFTQKEPGQEGILVGHGEATKSPFSPARASTERTYPTPLQKLRDTMAIGPEIVSNRVDPVIQSREFPAILNSKVEAKKHETGESRVLEEFYQPRIPEAVRATLPANGTRSVALFHPISLIFKRELQKGEEGYLQAKIYADGREIPVQSHYQKSHQRIDLIPQESLQPGTQYRVIAGQAAFEFSTEGAKLQLSSTGKKGSIRPVMNAPREARSFKIARVFPRHQSRNNKVHAPIRIRFSSEIDPDTIHASTVAIYMDDQLIPGELTFETNDRELSLKPYRNLQEAGVYEVRIDSTLRSKNGSQLEGPKNWKFKTEHFTPFLIEKFPHSVMDSVDGVLTLELNREADPGSIRSDEFFLQGESFQYKGRVDLHDGGKKLVFKPHQRIPDQQEFQFYVSPNLRDLDGNNLQNNKTVSIAARFSTKSLGTRTLARAREYFPRDRNPQAGGEEFYPVLENFSRKGYIQSKEPIHIKDTQRTPSRYQVARWVEESLSSVPRMNAEDKKALKDLIHAYRAELRNLGVDLNKWSGQIEGSRRSSQRPVNRFSRQAANDFVSRGRRL